MAFAVTMIVPVAPELTDRPPVPVELASEADALVTVHLRTRTRLLPQGIGMK